jgi:DNA (cytosine-5)-methyltransferase 1
MANKLLAVDIFAGAGGLSLGFEKAGFSTVFAVEQDESSCITYKKNRRNFNDRIICDDISNISFKEQLVKFKKTQGRIDILLGGPPCQGYSTSNTVNRFKNNKQNNLFKEYFRAVGEIKPKWLLFENVAGITDFRKGKITDIFKEYLTKLGYKKFQNSVINAAAYGIPQIRRRFFLIANRLDLDFTFPVETHNEETYLKVSDAITDLPIIRNGNETDIKHYRNHGSKVTEYQMILRKRIRKKFVYNNLVTRNGELVCDRYKHIPQGGNWKDIPSELMENYANKDNCHTGIYKRLKMNRPSIVISNFRKNMLIHPTQDRGLSVREAARLQSFPDTYVFHGNLGEQQQQVANAVPPLLAEQIALKIKELII